MENYIEEVSARPQAAWTSDRWRRLAEDLLVLLAFALTSSWLMRP